MRSSGYEYSANSLWTRNSLYSGNAAIVFGLLIFKTLRNAANLESETKAGKVF